MGNPRYSQEMKEAIRQMLAEGQTQKEVAEYFGLKDRFVVHQIVKRDRRKQEAAGGLSKKKGRPSNHSPETLAALKAENQRLKMENDLLGCFLHVLERKWGLKIW